MLLWQRNYDAGCVAACVSGVTENQGRDWGCAPAFETTCGSVCQVWEVFDVQLWQG